MIFFSSSSSLFEFLNFFDFFRHEMKICIVRYAANFMPSILRSFSNSLPESYLEMMAGKTELKHWSCNKMIHLLNPGSKRNSGGERIRGESLIKTRIFPSVENPLPVLASLSPFGEPCPLSCGGLSSGFTPDPLYCFFLFSFLHK